MARADVPPEERDRPLVLISLVDCPMCGTEQEADFVAPDGVTEAQDLTEAPETTVQCLWCRHRWSESYQGWVAHEDAG